MKGYVYTIEAFVAVAIIFLSVFFSLQFAGYYPETRSSVIKTRGYNAIEHLDDTGQLRSLVMKGNEKSIEGNITNLIGNEINVTVKICSLVCQQPSLPANTTIVPVEYYISSSSETYIGKKLVAWFWGRY
ncbi:MAG: hypothetical protein V1802_01695 [Candidatus Aenigmatarchaeota archaeon]